MGTFRQNRPLAASLVITVRMPAIGSNQSCIPFVQRQLARFILFYEHALSVLHSFVFDRG